jgi:hypothetical protein
MGASGNRSSNCRKRALRRLAREQAASYAAIYEKIRPAEGAPVNARGKAWTMLRHQYPDRYMELFAEEQIAPAAEIPAAIRSKSWSRASARLADLRADAHRESYEQFRRQGMPDPRAWDRAVAVIREADADLFTRLLTEEYRLWLFAASLDSGVQ